MKNSRSCSKKILSMLLAAAVAAVSVPQEPFLVNAAGVNESVETLEDTSQDSSGASSWDGGDGPAASGSDGASEAVSGEYQTGELPGNRADVRMIIADGNCYNNSPVIWTLYDDGELVVEGTGEIVGADYESPIPWRDYFDQIKSATVRVSGATTAYKMFAYCKNLRKLDLKGFDTTNVTNMSQMFVDCESLTTADLSGLHTENVTDMSQMFSGCKSLTTVNLSGFHTEKVMGMSYMFSGCSSLAAVDVSSFQTDSVYNMQGMFRYCYALKELDLSNFDTSGVTDMGYMFDGCIALQKIDISGFDTTKATEQGRMFLDCRSLETLDLSSFVITSKHNTTDMLLDCGKLKKLITPREMGRGIVLPVPSASLSWRKADGTKILEIGQELAGGVTISTDTHIGISFEGTNYKLEGYGDTNIGDIEKVFEKGAKESFAFTIVPDAGYDVTPVVRSRTAFSAVTISQGASPYQFVITPKDTAQGYVHDEVIDVKVARAGTYALGIEVNSERIEDYFVVSNGKKLEANESAKVPVENKYDVTIYVKLAQDEASENSGRRIPALWLSEQGENNNQRKIYSVKDTDSLTDEEKKFAGGGYRVFRLGRIYKGVTAAIVDDYECSVTVMSEGFPEEFRIIRYVEDEYGVYQEQECDKPIIVEGGEDFFIQVQYTDTRNDHKWCSGNVGQRYVGDNGWWPVKTATLPGVEGKVWSVDTLNIHNGDLEVLVSLKPYTILLGCNSGDIGNLTVSEGAAVSEDGKCLEVHKGDSLSMSFTLAENITLKRVWVEDNRRNDITEGIEIQTTEAGGKYTVSIADLSKLSDIWRINFDVEDSLNRVSLGDPMNPPSVRATYTSQYYCGKDIVDRSLTVTIGDATLQKNVDYRTVFYNNRNAGQATMLIQAMPDSQKYRGEYAVSFTIEKVSLPAVPAAELYVESHTSQIDLSEQFVIQGTYDDKVSPERYSLVSCDRGGILNGDPALDGNVLTYHIKEGAGRDSDPAVITLRASFENYRDKELKLIIHLVKREELTLGGKLVEDKVYDGMAISPDLGRLQVLTREGTAVSAGDAAAILGDIKDTLIYRYTGTDGTTYDSDQPPVEAGSYRLQVKVSEENLYYKSDYLDAGSFKISRREVIFTAQDDLLYIGDSLPEYRYSTEGLVEGHTVERGKAPVLSCSIQDTQKAGDYPVLIDVSGVRISDGTGRDVTADYRPVGKEGTVTIREPEPGSYTVTFCLSGKGADIRKSGMVSGNLIARPIDPECEGYVFLGWYLDETLSKKWDFDSDVIQGDMTLYAGWSLDPESDDSLELCVQEILPQTYTGKAIKPAVTVYAADGKTPLKKNKDYRVTYKNNVEADTRKFNGAASIPEGGIGSGLTDDTQGFNSELAYAVITGKGNYTGTVYMNFHIVPVDISNADRSSSGITLKYTDCFEEKSGKSASIVTQFKTKTSKLKYGTDYTLTVKKAADGAPVILNEKGQLPLESGTYSCIMEGKGNYTGSLEKTLYVAPKAQLLKNAKLKITGTITGVTKEQLAAGVELSELEVSIGGNTLQKDVDYEVAYSNHHAIGTATVIVRGKGSYSGVKRASFKIKGIPFKEKEFGTVSVQDMTYTGAPLTQNDVQLAKGAAKLIYGEDYTISYKNNIKKGKATMTFTAKPSSGYSGSFKKTFAIKPLQLNSDGILLQGAEKKSGSAGWKLTESVPYQKAGATPAVRLQAGAGGPFLTAGRDYAVKYKDNKDISEGKAYMTLTGKGNYAGSITVYFDIRQASLAELYQAGTLSVTAKSVKATFPYQKDSETEDKVLKDPDYAYEPAIVIKDGKKTLKKDVDYTVTYEGNTRGELEYGGSPWATITGLGNYGNTSGKEDDFITIPLSIYQKTLSGSSIYVVYDEDTDFAYTGEPITPGVTVYYGKPSDISRAKRNKVTEEDKLTAEKSEDDSSDEEAYGLTKLQEYGEGKGGDYILSYGANTAKGKSGKVMIRGIYDYGGNVTVTFTITPKELYKLYAPEEE